MGISIVLSRILKYRNWPNDPGGLPLRSNQIKIWRHMMKNENCLYSAQRKSMKNLETVAFFFLKYTF